MPIRFRCSYCNRLLGIATRKAGMETMCPHCGYTITVPMPQEDHAQTERINLDDVDELLGKSHSSTAKESAVVAAPASAPPAKNPGSAPTPQPSTVQPAATVPPPAKPRPAPPPVPKPSPNPANPNEPPLFEGDVDAILGATASPEEPEMAKPPAATGMDAMSLSEPPRTLVITSQKATLLMVLVVVLMILSFATGYFLAR